MIYDYPHRPINECLEKFTLDHGIVSACGNLKIKKMILAELIDSGGETFFLNPINIDINLTDEHYARLQQLVEYQSMEDVRLTMSIDFTHKSLEHLMLLPLLEDVDVSEKTHFPIVRFSLAKTFEG